jgi:3-oxoacyl-[acyl-carrier protein] reductase
MSVAGTAPVVLVTGGSRGLGAAMVERLLADGYRVATCSRQRSETIEAFEGTHGPARFFWQAAAIGTEADEHALFEAVTGWAGPAGLYGLVNNAGRAGEGILATFPNVESEGILAVNLVGPLRLTRLALRLLLAQNRPGRIVNVSSIVGQRGYTGLTAYAASKAGLDGLTRALAREVGRRQITVNSVAPGYVVTELSSTLSARQRQQIVNRTPLGRLIDPEDVAAVVAFLLGPGARSITGTTIVVDGGLIC